MQAKQAIKFNKNHSAYQVFVFDKVYEIIARSEKEAMNIARFKYCYRFCIVKISFCTLVDKIELRKMIKDFDNSKITVKLMANGTVLKYGEISNDKKYVKIQWEELIDIEREQFLNDAVQNEINLITEG